MKLTEKQSKIVNHLEGALLVTAGPGSGKTRVLTQRIINILESRKGRVLALTFSNKAAEEISERVQEMLSSDAYHRVNVGTIHSFCLDIVTNRGKQIGLPGGLTILENLPDKLELLKKVTNELLIQQLDDNAIKNTLQNIQKYKQKFIVPDMIEKNLESPNFINIYEGYNNLLLKNRMIDFDDILFYAYRILTEKPKIASNYTRLYKYILIDEAQDLNQTQYQVIKALTPNFNNLMMVGDPEQSIYGFNGSNSSIMTEKFKNDFNPTIYSLNENFRSTSKIISAANKIQPESKSKSVFPLEGILETKAFQNKESEAQWIVNKIKGLIQKGSPWVEHPIEFKNIGIIGRNRYVFSEIERIFKEEQIDVSYGNSNSSLESETLEMKIFEVGVRIIVNPFDELHYLQLNNYLKRTPKNSDFLDDILDNRECNNKLVNNTIFQVIVNSWNNIYQNIESFSKSLELIHRIASDCDLPEDFEFLLQNDIKLWESRWRKYISTSVGGDRKLSDFRNQIALGKLNTSNENGISLLTVHMSKGLEFDIVFIVDLTEGTFPDYRVETVLEQKEERNNMFVALTRAKRECYLTYPLEKMMPWGTSKKQRKSRYIEIIES